MIKSLRFLGMRTGAGALAVVLGGLLFSALPQGAQAEEVKFDSLTGRLRHLVIIDHEIRKLKASVEQTKQKEMLPLYNYSPRVQVTASSGLENQHKDNADNTDMNPLQFQAKVTQRLWDFGTTSAERRSAHFLRLGMEAEYHAKVQERIRKGIDSFLDIIDSYKQLQFTKRSELTINKLTGEEEVRVQRGRGYASDVLDFKSTLAKVRAKMIVAEKNLQKSVETYGSYFQHRLTPEDVAELHLPRPPRSALPETEDEAVQIALRDNFTVLRRTMIRDYRRADLDRQKLQDTPKLNLVGSSTHKHEVAGTAGNKDEYLVQVELSYTPFTDRDNSNAGMGANRVMVAEKVGLVEEFQFALEEEKRQVELETRKAWTDIEAQVNNQRLLDEEQTLRQHFVQLALEEYRNTTRRRPLDLITAEQKLLEVREKLIGSQVALYKAFYQLLDLMGRLSLDRIEESGDS